MGAASRTCELARTWEEKWLRLVPAGWRRENGIMYGVEERKQGGGQ